MMPAPPLCALTVWQPWATAIALGKKRLENRDWAPPPRFVGQDIAIHAAAYLEPLRLAHVADALGMTVAELEVEPRKAIIAVVRLTGVVRSSRDPWFTGPFGWEFADARRLASPIPCSGKQGLWGVGREIEADVLNQLALPA